MTNIISDAHAADIVRRHWSINQDIALAVAMAESGLNADAHNTSGEDSRGLWQINVVPAANPQYADWDLFNPEICAQAAYEISSAGHWWCPWSVYEETCGPGHTGSYRNYLERARAALGLPLPPPPPPPISHYPASNLGISLSVANCLVFARFSWTRGYPDLIGQRLDLAIHPFTGWQYSYDIPAGQSSLQLSGLTPNATYYWRLASLFSTFDLYSSSSLFIAPQLPDSCISPPPPPPSNITMLLGIGLVAVSLVLALTPRKKKIIKK